MSKANKNAMIRVPIEIWEAAQAYGIDIDRPGVWVVSDWLRRGALLDNVIIPKKSKIGVKE